jgi:hypothetical protein
MNASLQNAIETELSPQQLAQLELLDSRCPACGRAKVQGHAFCARDMKKLTAKQRADLNFATGSAWFVLYEEAKAALAPPKGGVA